MILVISWVAILIHTFRLGSSFKLKNHSYLHSSVFSLTFLITVFFFHRFTLAGMLPQAIDRILSNMLTLFWKGCKSRAMWQCFCQTVKRSQWLVLWKNWQTITSKSITWKGPTDGSRLHETFQGQGNLGQKFFQRSALFSIPLNLPKQTSYR